MWGPEPRPPARTHGPSRPVTTPAGCQHPSRPVTSQSGSQKCKVVGRPGRFLPRPGGRVCPMPSLAPPGSLAIPGFLVKLVSQSGEMVPPHPDTLSCAPGSVVLLGRGTHASGVGVGPQRRQRLLGYKGGSPSPGQVSTEGTEQHPPDLPWPPFLPPPTLYPQQRPREAGAVHRPRLTSWPCCPGTRAADWKTAPEQTWLPTSQRPQGGGPGLGGGLPPVEELRCGAASPVPARPWRAWAVVARAVLRNQGWPGAGHVARGAPGCEAACSTHPLGALLEHRRVWKLLPGRHLRQAAEPVSRCDARQVGEASGRAGCGWTGAAPRQSGVGPAGVSPTGVGRARAGMLTTLGRFPRVLAAGLALAPGPWAQQESVFLPYESVSVPGATREGSGISPCPPRAPAPEAAGGCEWLVWVGVRPREALMIGPRDACAGRRPVPDQRASR